MHRLTILAAWMLMAALMGGCGDEIPTEVENTAPPAATPVVETVTPTPSVPPDTQLPATLPPTEPPVLPTETVAPTETPAPASKGILIAIDPGHQAFSVDMSAKEPNAPGSSVMKTKASTGTTGRFSGIAEYELNLDISLLLRDALEELGYEVVMTRENNETAISNSERAQLANNAGADICIRIHANGSNDSSVAGALAIIASSQNPYVGQLYNESYRLSDCVLSAYCEETGLRNRGIQVNDTMTGLNWSQIPVMILEMGFMTNQSDDLNMADPAFRTTMVQGIVNGIEAYYADSAS